MQGDALAIMADTFVRLVTIEIVKVLVWAPVLLAACYLHTRWSK